MKGVTADKIRTGMVVRLGRSRDWTPVRVVGTYRSVDPQRTGLWLEKGAWVEPFKTLVIEVIS